MYSYFLTLSISQLVSLFSSKKQFSLTQKVNLEIREFNYCEKTGFMEMMLTYSFRGAA